MMSGDGAQQFSPFVFGRLLEILISYFRETTKISINDDKKTFLEICFHKQIIEQGWMHLF